MLHLFRSLISTVLPILLLLLLTNPAVAAGLPTIKKLKNLHLTTSLVDKGAVQAVIVAPVGERYRTEVAQLNERIRLLTGTTLPVLIDDKLPEELLRNRNVITLGNMATNAFIEKLYRQWQVILDLKYPGEGGFVVRSLHNPYTTGHNVIFLGGSDDAGVSAAVKAFCDGLKGAATLKVGRLAQIRLGKGLTLPVISADMKKWDVKSWNDSWRKDSSGREIGYPSATFFGWSPISIAGTLYYMTGKKEYLDCFKELVLPVSGHIPPAILASDAFSVPSDPLVKSYHYRAHLLDLIYDLIEESPLFRDDERLRITNKLVEHQSDLDPTSTYSRPSGDRHATWHMLCIYTGSRYFLRYYPDPLWERRLENVRRGFAAFNSDPTWGGQEDTLNWVATFVEPLFEFALLDGSDEFVRSGAARIFMKGLETLRTGEEVDDYNYFLPDNLLFKAAWLLHDSRYVWMAQQSGFNSSGFRIGQSWWPTDALNVNPPLDLAGRVTIAPLSRIDRNNSKTSVLQEEAFQLLSYRTGLNKNDDFLLLDGFSGTGRHPFQLNTLLRLRMFNGKTILSGFGNDLNIWRNGLAEPHVAKVAALKGELAAKDFAYLRTEVPDMPGTRWERRILYLKGLFAVVVDRVVARQSGSFDLLSSWEMGGQLKSGNSVSRRILSSSGAVLVSADLPYQRISPTIVQAKVSRDLGKDESLVLANLFASNVSPKAISPLKQGGYLISGSHTAFINAGAVTRPGFSAKSGFCYLDSGRMLLEEATELVLQGQVLFSSDSPVTLCWNLKEGSVDFSAVHAARVRLAGREINISPGKSRVDVGLPSTELTGQLVSLLGLLDQEVINPPLSGSNAEVLPPASWQPVWECSFKGKITVMANADPSGTGGVWAVSQDKQAATINRIAATGQLMQSVRQPGDILTIVSAASTKQARAFSLLAGFKDDMLRAYTENGSELWAVKATIHPGFFVGDHYDAPWFTNPGPPNNMTGVYALLVGDFWNRGGDEIAIGRPSTVEFRGLDGKFLASAPTRWGTNTSLAAVKKGAAAGNGSLLLAGKGYAGNPTLSGISGQYKNISDGLYSVLLPEFDNMHSWLMRGLTALRVADLDGDGAEEVVYTLSGHWNELRVYDGSGKPLWMKFFGSDKNRAGTPFMSALELADLHGDGRKELLIGTRLGWLSVFDCQGNQLWQHRFDSGISSLSVSASGGKIVVGCDNGLLILLDKTGRQLATGSMGSAVTSLLLSGGTLYAGSSNGQVRQYEVLFNTFNVTQ